LSKSREGNRSEAMVTPGGKRVVFLGSEQGSKITDHEKNAELERERILKMHGGSDQKENDKVDAFVPGQAFQDSIPQNPGPKGTFFKNTGNQGAVY